MLKWKTVQFFFLTHSVERESRRAYIEYHFQVDLSRVQGTAWLGKVGCRTVADFDMSGGPTASAAKFWICWSRFISNLFDNLED